MKTKTTKKKPWGEMTVAELAEATKEFDHPLPASRFRPLSKKERAIFDRASRAGAHGRELLKILNLDPKLVSEAEAYARRMKISVNEVIALGIRKVIHAKRS